MGNIDFSQFEIVHKNRTTKYDLLKCINFFNSLEVIVQDVTTPTEYSNQQKKVVVKYIYEDKNYLSKPLYYREITNSDNIRDIEKTHAYFQDKVYVLDLHHHGWPQPSGKSDLDKLVIDDITDDAEFKDFLKVLANNNQTGYIQQITKEGRTAQYYHNLENNNHWHDLVILIKEAIKLRGKKINKRFFNPLIFNWDSGKRTSLGFNKGGGDFGLISQLYKNIKAIQMQLPDKELINLLKYKKQIILQGPPGTGKTRLAKIIAQNLIGFDKNVSTKEGVLRLLIVGQELKTVAGDIKFTIKNILEDENNLEIFVGHIPGTFSIEFSEIDVVFKNKSWEGKQSNWDSKSKIHYEVAIAKYIYDNIYKLNTKIDDSEQFKLIQFHPSYTYEDFVRGIVANSKGDKIEYKNVNKLLGKFAEEACENSSVNYILIIDEINRANLSSVLGELIYALEYRGEEVESMYEVDGVNKLVLPPNLYIIGTMNTADRSVGHIDYAIRRRFAFVDILPKKLEDADIVFHHVLFKEVSGLFIKNYDNYVLDNATPLVNEKEYLSEEFDAKDVWLGHSYFIQKKINDTTTLEPENFNIKVKYEIVPILREYVKDGILNEKATTIINGIEQSYSVN